MRHSSSNVMPFEQNAEFFLRRAQKQRQAGRYREALSLMWRAVQASSRKSEYLMELAELYSEMGCPLESNRCLIDLMSRPDADASCWFGLACNLYAMGNTTGAQTAALAYIELAPEGAYHEEAAQLLSALRYAEHISEPAERRLLRCHRLNSRAAALINDDQPRAALPFIEQSLARHDVPATQALYAFALSEAGETQRALSEAEMLLHRRGLQTADCLYALRVLVSANERERALDVAKALKKHSLDAYERRQLFDALLPLCPEQIETLLTEELKDSPFDRRLWHVRAALDYNTGQRDEALSQWRAMLALNPYDPLAALYIDALSNGHAPHAPIPLSDEPAPSLRDETCLAVLTGTANAVQRRWVLLSGESGAYRVIDFLAAQGDEEALLLLRLALAEPSLPHPVKLHALCTLAALGGAAPYLLIDRSRLVLKTELPAADDVYAQRILRRLVPLAADIDTRLVPWLAGLWSTNTSTLPRHESAKYALGAALLCHAAQNLNLDDPTPQLKKALNLSARSLAYYKSLLNKQMRKDDFHDAD